MCGVTTCVVLCSRMWLRGPLARGFQLSMSVCGWCVFCDGQVAAGMEPNSSDGSSFLVYDDIWSSSL